MCSSPTRSRRCESSSTPCSSPERCVCIRITVVCIRSNSRNLCCAQLVVAQLAVFERRFRHYDFAAVQKAGFTHVYLTSIIIGAVCKSAPRNVRHLHHRHREKTWIKNVIETVPRVAVGGSWVTGITLNESFTLCMCGKSRDLLLTPIAHLNDMVSTLDADFHTRPLFFWGLWWVYIAGSVGHITSA